MSQGSRTRRASALPVLLLGAALPLGSAPAAAAPCVPFAGAASRDSGSFRDPEPDTVLLQAVARLKAADPHATVRFHNCEVDSFATRARETVPGYARRVLLAAGLSAEPRPVERLPKPTLAAKGTQDLDGTLLQSHKLPLAAEPTPPPPLKAEGRSDGAEGDPRPGTPLLEARTEPALELEPRDSTFVPPPPALLKRERAVAKRILLGFLAENDDVFRLGKRALATGLPGLKVTEYRAGRFSRALTFTQSVGQVPVLEGQTQVLFDANWNVVGISRTLYTSAKLSWPPTSVLPRGKAVATARKTVAELTGKPPADFTPRAVVLGVDPLRRQRTWQVQMVAQSSPEFDFTVLLDATGAVLNVSDNVDAFTDAKTRRWAYTGGDQTKPYQVISTGVYTRDDNTLRHDFFFLETDERGGGIVGQSPCDAADTSTKSVWRPFAWGTNSSPFSFIRHTHRSDRDFSIWSPAHSSGSFGESHTYYWSRQYFQWMKPALNELGVLPASAADYPKITLLTNACIDDIGYANSSLAVTIHLNEGEAEGKVRLADQCREGNPQCAESDYDPANSSSFRTCEGGGCHPSPSVIHHEINHRVLGGMFGIGSSLDCAASDQRKFLHEGLMGSVLPQAFWHFWYGVGFDPDPARLFTASAVRGRVHADGASNLVLSDYFCTNNDDGGQGAYEAGRVAGQPLWEIFHGKRVEGNQVLGTWRPATDTDFLILSYWAADLMASSTFKDRYEFANRVMQLLELNDWPSEAKQDYCEIFAHHELDNFIEPSYCS
jgi:hypothetical protein